MEKIIWRMEFASPPNIKKYCKKCGDKTEFFSSKLFRVNANQKKLDIWLIYKCNLCKRTWNRTLFSGVKPNAFSGDTLEKFHSNNAGLACAYAMDCGELFRTGFEVIIPTFEVIGGEMNCDSSAKTSHEILLLSGFCFNIKISTILKQKLGISNSQLEILIKNNQISCNTNANFKRCKLQKEQRLKIIGQ